MSISEALNSARSRVESLTHSLSEARTEKVRHQISDRIRLAGRDVVAAARAVAHATIDELGTALKGASAKQKEDVAKRAFEVMKEFAKDADHTVFNRALVAYLEASK